jgi:hypothetical protein
MARTMERTLQQKTDYTVDETAGEITFKSGLKRVKMQISYPYNWPGDVVVKAKFTLLQFISWKLYRVLAKALGIQ